MRTEERGMCGVIGSGVVCVKYNVNTGIRTKQKKHLGESRVASRREEEK